MKRFYVKFNLLCIQVGFQIAFLGKSLTTEVTYAGSRQWISAC